MTEKKKILIQLSGEDRKIFTDLLEQFDVEIADGSLRENTLQNVGLIVKCGEYDVLVTRMLKEVHKVRDHTLLRIQLELLHAVARVELLLSGIDGDLNKQQLEHLEIIQKRLTRIQDDIQSYIPPRQLLGSQERFQVEHLLLIIAESFQRSQNLNISNIELNFDEDLPFATGIVVDFEQWVYYLLRVIARNSLANSVIAISAQALKKFIQISISSGNLILISKKNLNMTLMKDCQIT